MQQQRHQIAVAYSEGFADFADPETITY